MSNSWIHTYTGQQVWPLEARGTFTRQDVAHHLSMKCRFNGATRRFYSVAEHSVRVAKLTGCIHGLMHDAGEAYLPDVASPIKRHLYARQTEKGLDAYAQFIGVEDNLLRAIYEQFGLDYTGRMLSAAEVHQADLTMLVTEANELLYGTKDWGIDLPEPLCVPSSAPLGWSPTRAKAAFLAAYDQLHK